MLTQLQKTAAIIALAICFATAIGAEIWQASHPPPSPNQSRPSQEGHQSGYDAQRERPDEAIARYNRYLAYFTGILASATIGLGIGTVFQLRLARAELVANYRPRLRVRNVIVNPPNEALVSRIGIFQPNQPARGQLYVVNVGGSAAKITESHCIVFWNESGLPMRRPYEGDNGNNQIPRMKLEPGQSTPGLFMSDDALDNRATTIGNSIAGGLRLYVMGWIEYADDRGTKRRTSFCREFEKRGGFAEGRFYAVADPDYEHEE
jgi:hypothetical protein